MQRVQGEREPVNRQRVEVGDFVDQPVLVERRDERRHAGRGDALPVSARARRKVPSPVSTNVRRNATL